MGKHAPLLNKCHFFIRTCFGIVFAGVMSDAYSAQDLLSQLDPCNRFTPQNYGEFQFVESSVNSALRELRKGHTCSYDFNNGVDLENPYRVCKEQQETALDYYDSCTVHDQVESTHSPRALLARREQIKTLLMQEMFYMKRISPNAPGFDRHWINFKERWTAILNQNPDVKALDQDGKLGPDQCSLHQMLGLGCGDSPDPGIIPEAKNEATRGHQLSAKLSGLPDNFRVDLVKAALLIDSAMPHGTAASTKNWYQSTFKTQPEKTAQANAIKDYVYAYFPEFEKDPSLVSDLLNSLDSHYDLKQLRDRFDRYNESNADISNRSNEIAKFLKEKIARDSLNYRDFDRLEIRFGQAREEIRKDFVRQIDRGRNDPNWLFDQDYLMQGALRTAASIQDDRDVAFFQTQICNNVRNERDLKTRRKHHMLYASVGIAATGLGAAFLSGPISMVVLASSIGMSSLVSVADIKAAYNELAKGQELFYSGGKTHSEVESDRHSKNFALAKGALTAVSGPTMLTLRQISLARQAAIAAGDLQKANELAKAETTVLRLNNAVDASFSGASLASGDVQGAIFGATMLGSSQFMTKFPALKEKATTMLRNRLRYMSASQTSDPAK